MEAPEELDGRISRLWSSLAPFSRLERGFRVLFVRSQPSVASTGGHSGSTWRFVQPRFVGKSVTSGILAAVPGVSWIDWPPHSRNKRFRIAPKWAFFVCSKRSPQAHFVRAERLEFEDWLKFGTAKDMS